MTAKKETCQGFLTKLNRQIQNMNNYSFEKTTFKFLEEIANIDSDEKFDSFFKGINTKNLYIPFIRSMRPLKKTLTHHDNINITVFPFFTNNEFLFHKLYSADATYFSKPVATMNSYQGFNELVNIILNTNPGENEAFSITNLSTNTLSLSFKLFQDTLLSEELLAKIVFLTLHRIHQENKPLLEILNYFEQNKNEHIQEYAENNIETYISFNNIFEKIINIAEVNIYDEEKLIKKSLKNPQLLEKYITHFGFEKFDQIYSEAVFKHKKADFFNRHANDEELRTSFIKEMINNVNNPIFDPGILHTLHSTGALSTILEKQPDFIQRYMHNFYERTNYRESTKAMLDMFKINYGIDYHYYYISEHMGKKVFKQIDKDNHYVLKHIIETNFNNVDPDALNYIIKSAMNSHIEDIIDTVFQHRHNVSANHIYLTMLNFFGSNKKIKYYSQEEGSLFLLKILSQEYRNNKGVTLNNEQIGHALLDKLSASDNISAIVSKFLLNEQFKQDTLPGFSAKRI